jgi:hypothetical protein
MRWLGWVGLLVLLMACTVQEPVVVERPTATAAIVTEVVAETAVPTFTVTATAVAIIIEPDSPIETVTPLPLPTDTIVPTPTYPPPATSTPTIFQPPFSHLAFSEQVGGHIQAVAVADGLAYVGIGPRLVVLDASNPAKPQKIGQSDLLSGVVQDILLHNGMAYVATGERGVWQIDVSEPQQPAVVQFIETSQMVSGLQANQTTLFAVTPSQDNESQVGVINLATNREIGRLTLPGKMLAEAFVENSLYTILQFTDLSDSRTYEFSHWDITDPLNPKQTGTLTLPGYSYDIFFDDTFAYLLDGLNSFLVVDISNPAQLTIIESTEELISPMERIRQAEVLPNNTFLLAVTACDAGSCGASLYKATQYEVLDYEGVGYIAYDMSLDNNIAYVATDTDLVIVDVGGSEGFKGIGRFQSTGIVESIATNGQQLYSSNQFGGITSIHSLDHLDEPETYTEYQHYADVNEMVIVDNHLFFATGQGLASGDIQIFDITDPLKPVELGGFRPEIPVHAVRNTILSNGIAYYLFEDYDNNSVTVIDVRDAEHMAEIGRFDETRIELFVLRDNWIYADSVILDISDLTNPQTVGQLPKMDGFIHDMVIINNELYVLTGGGELTNLLYTLDLSQPTSPQIIHEQEVDNSISSLTMYNNLLIGLGNDVWAFEISQAEEPVLVDHFVTAGLAKEAVVANGRLYVADGEGGILIFDGVP